jgi:hypothetical protein
VVGGTAYRPDSCPSGSPKMVVAVRERGASLIPAKLKKLKKNIKGEIKVGVALLKEQRSRTGFYP